MYTFISYSSDVILNLCVVYANRMAHTQIPSQELFKFTKKTEMSNTIPTYFSSSSFLTFNGLRYTVGLRRRFTYVFCHISVLLSSNNINAIFLPLLHSFNSFRSFSFIHSFIHLWVNRSINKYVFMFVPQKNRKKSCKKCRTNAYTSSIAFTTKMTDSSAKVTTRQRLLSAAAALLLGY